MIKKKEMICFIEKIKETMLDNIKADEKKYVIIKITLLKWIFDHNLIDIDDIKENNLKEDFTLQKMLYMIGGQKIHLMEEYHHNFSLEAFERLYNILKDKDVFSTSKSTILGIVYEYLNEMEERKKGGMYYTPSFIIDFMLEEPIEQLDINDKIIDPACGSGFFLSIAYDKLFDYYQKNPSILGDNKTIIHDRILKQLYGIEKDMIAAAITKLILFLKQPDHSNPNINIFCKDSLLDRIPNIEEGSFSLVIGNPPYIGHKKIDKDYNLLLKKKYRKVYHDKGDISYCFFQKAIDLLKEGGTVSYITSRYFLEALYGENLREYILNNYTIHEIIDFYGQRIFKGIGIDPIIIHLRKNSKKIDSYHEICITRLKDLKGNIPGEELIDTITKKKQSPYIKYFSIAQTSLHKDGWRLLDACSQSIIQKIEKRCSLQLKDICQSKQGVITGRDKAFIITKEEAKNKALRGKLLKPWIKGKNISEFQIEKNTQLLLYSNDIDNINEWEAEKAHLLPYKEKLQNRRECLRGYRKWYELQWGREKEFFQSRKIIFPYKASKNKFVLDEEGYYYSADVYGIRLRDDYKNYISLEVLTLLLNSNIYEFYFKGFAKKLGENLYEYYPNTLMELFIPQLGAEEEKLKTYYNQKMNFIREGNQKEIQSIKKEIEQYLLGYFDLSQVEEEYLISSIQS